MSRILNEIEAQVKRIDQVNSNLNNFVATHMEVQKEEMKKVYQLVDQLAKEVEK